MRREKALHAKAPSTNDDVMSFERQGCDCAQWCESSRSSFWERSFRSRAGPGDGKSEVRAMDVAELGRSPLGRGSRGGARSGQIGVTRPGGAKSAPRRTKMAQESHKTATRRPKTAQESHKRATRRPKTATRRPKIDQDGSRWTQDGSRWGAKRQN